MTRGLEVRSLAFKIADVSAAADIECNLRPVEKDAVEWFDLESCNRTLRRELLRAARYLELRSLLIRDVEQPSLIRVRGRAS
jgi:hypothetical protein